MRSRRLLVVLLLAGLSLGACGEGDGDSRTGPQESASASADADDCAGGDVRFLQGMPTDLPGGGEGGIGQVDMDADPPTVRLVLAGDTATPPTAGALSVGDTFTVEGTTYRITAICPGKVTAARK